jgi:radical SAM protein with 4Fe4S-binding SPASM domain
MIVYWRVGNKCNLGCKYCKIVGVSKFKESKEKSPNENYVSDVASFIRKLAETEREGDFSLVYYGGEPLLYRESINRFNSLTKDIPIRRVLHTNGILLSELDSEFLKFIDMILVSVDGKERTNDKNRGIGTYSRVREGVEHIRRFCSCEIVARATLSLDGSIKESITDILGWLDGVFWQIENSPYYNPAISNAFLRRYEQDIDDLTSFWMESLECGKALNILPFQAIAGTMLQKKKEVNLRCGCGSRLIIIDGTKCYACDELEGKCKEVYLGTIYETVSPKSDEITFKVNETCKNCQFLYTCHGRCYNSLSQFPEEKFQLYCSATRSLINRVSQLIPEIENLIKTGNLTLEQILHPALDVVDQIP